MISELANAITAAMRDVQLTSTNTTKMRRKLLAAVVDPLLPSMSLDQVSALARGGHGDVLDHVLRDMTLAQLKTVSGKWNSHRKVGADVIMRDLQIELRDLVAGRRRPALDPALLASWSLLDARGRYLRDQGLIEEALSAMPLPQLRRVSRKWDAHRRLPQGASLSDLRCEVSDLVSGKRHADPPQPPPPPRPRTRRPRIRAAAIAAE